MTTNPSHAGRQAEARAVTEFDVTYFGLAGLEHDALMDLYADHAYKFAERHGLETPLISSRSFPTVEEWEAPAESDTWRHKAIRRHLGMARLERERDEARAQIERVRALADEYARGRGGPTARRIREALDEPKGENEGA